MSKPHSRQKVNRTMRGMVTAEMRFYPII